MKYKCHSPILKEENHIVDKPLSKELADVLLKTGQCHIDHEGFDLNEIERGYYEANNVLIYHDDTWYKDGGKENGTTTILQPWYVQTGAIDEDNLIIDHSHYVFKYPIRGEAKEQVLQYAKERPELYRLVSTNYKCGLDLCIDYMNPESYTIEPILHIEWDYNNTHELLQKALEVERVINNPNSWKDVIPTILRYNKIARTKQIDAFIQADTRAGVLLGEKAYKLIPTL